MTLQISQSQRYNYLADDDEDDRQMFHEALLEVNSNAVLTQAEDGKELLEILSKNPKPLPEVIFLDINMPKIGGFECLEQIKQNKKLNKMPIIMLSTSSDPLTINRALQLGANFYAVKPSTFEDIKLLIKKVLQMDCLSIQNDKQKFRLA